jgi:hypothetical protein
MKQIQLARPNTESRKLMSRQKHDENISQMECRTLRQNQDIQFYIQRR